ncbi:acyl-coenzyme A thioesterase 5-like [Ambystoma mexicanum]|uniref:acyl-coenzyme A thioesterase 5-like n=1 Tax=Ambystoma mexicanum TaxID=8296 RepID=UPI0037E9980F
MLRVVAVRAWGLCSRPPGLCTLRSAASIAVHFPRPCLADQPLGIKVLGLDPLQEVTLRALVESEHGSLFDSCAHYRADGQGNIDLDTAPSTGGHYTGVMPMGLLWSLTPAALEHPYDRLEKKDVVKTPMRVELLVHKGHSQPKELPGLVLAKEKVDRWFAAPGVQRIRLREGDVRGSLFLPPGYGPFPGVIDLFGDEGGLVEYRSSLLASRGFASLALPYFGFEDLPRMMKDFHLEYFEEAAKFLLRHPKVKGPGVGVIGTGKGADLALSMVTFLQEVKVGVSISGCCSNTAASLHYGEQTIPALRYDMGMVQISDTAVFDIFESLGDPMDPENKQSIIPIENADGQFLFVVGEGDRNWKSSLYAQLAVSRLREHGKDNFQLLSYPGAGHRIDPPCSPFCIAARDRVLGVPILGGGEMEAHCRAQVDSWEKIQAFLQLHLS